jgi:hypothetical protein
MAKEIVIDKSVRHHLRATSYCDKQAVKCIPLVDALVGGDVDPAFERSGLELEIYDRFRSSIAREGWSVDVRRLYFGGIRRKMSSALSANGLGEREKGRGD